MLEKHSEDHACTETWLSSKTVGKTNRKVLPNADLTGYKAVDCGEQIPNETHILVLFSPKKTSAGLNRYSLGPETIKTNTNHA